MVKNIRPRIWPLLLLLLVMLILVYASLCVVNKRIITHPNQFMNMEAYLYIWHESGDEIHMDLYTKKQDFEDMKQVDLHAQGSWEKMFGKLNPQPDPHKHFFMQTFCIDNWPFGDFDIKEVYHSGWAGC